MDPSPARSHVSARGERLHSWKEIAAYLKRDIRTLQRWEKHEGLPVHRHLHDERGTAYAYSGEIDEWLEKRSRRNSEGGVADGTDGSGRPAAAAQAHGRLAKRLAMWGVVAVAGIGSVWAAWVLARPGSDPSPRLSSLSVVFAPSERFHDWGPDVALSPDGSTLVYVGIGGRLVVRRIDQLSGHALEGTDGSWGPFFSPDGRWIGFNHRGQLKKVPVTGGAPYPLGVSAGFIGAADWGSDDFIVYATLTPHGSHGVYRVPSTGGPPQLVAALDANADEAFFLTPQSIAGGRFILCTLATPASALRVQAIAVSVATGERRVIVEDARHAMSIGDGVLVYWRNGALWASRFDADRPAVVGPPVPAWDDVWERVRLRSWASAAGTLVYWPKARLDRRLVWVDREGRQEPLALPPAPYGAPRISPDGRSVAYAIGHGVSDIWRHDFTTGDTVRLTSDGRSATPVWTPDGSGLLISWQRAGGLDLAQLAVDGTGTPEPIAVPARFLPGAAKMPVWPADGGRTLLVRQFGLLEQPALWALALDGSRDPWPVRPEYPSHGHLSPDGRWLAYESWFDGRSEIVVTSFPTAGQRWQVSTDGGTLPVWSRSGRELFYRRQLKLMAVPVTLNAQFSAGPARELFEAPFYDGDPGSPNYDVAPDGQRFLTVVAATTGGPDRLNVIQGWKAEIVRRLDESR